MSRSLSVLSHLTCARQVGPGWRRAAFAAMGLAITAAAGSPGVLFAQTAPRWTISASFDAFRAGSREGWGYGPALSVRRDFGTHWGAMVQGALPAFGSNAGAAAVDAAVTYTHVRAGAELGAAGGLSGFLVGGSSEFIGGGIGAVLATHGTWWIRPGAGVTLLASARSSFQVKLHVYPSVGAGFSLRF